MENPTNRDIRLAVVLKLSKQLEKLKASLTDEELLYDCAANSYVRLYDIVAGDTTIVRDLKNIGIPVDKDVRNKLAHCSSCIKDVMTSYLTGMLSEKLRAYLMDNYYNLVMNFTDGHVIIGPHGVEMSTTAVKDSPKDTSIDDIDID